jgi:hypothetical protein
MATNRNQPKHELLAQRQEKAERRELGLHPFGSGFRPPTWRGHARRHAADDAAALEAPARNYHRRAGGGGAARQAAFLKLRDRSGDSRSTSSGTRWESSSSASRSPTWATVGATGKLFRSKTGGLTLAVTDTAR